MLWWTYGLASNVAWLVQESLATYNWHQDKDKNTAFMKGEEKEFQYLEKLHLLNNANIPLHLLYEF